MLENTWGHHKNWQSRAGERERERGSGEDLREDALGGACETIIYRAFIYLGYIIARGHVTWFSPTTMTAAIPNQLELERLLRFHCCCCCCCWLGVLPLPLSCCFFPAPSENWGNEGPHNKDKQRTQGESKRIESKWKRIRSDGYGLYSPSIEARYRVTENCLECPFPHCGQCNVVCEITSSSLARV